MQFKLHEFPSLYSKPTQEKIEKDVSSTLDAITTDGKNFVVNDSPWYFKKRRGGASRCVVNSASYISTKFQAELSTKENWKGETKKNGQAIDGYLEVEVKGPAFKLEKARLIPFLEAYLEMAKLSESRLGLLFTRFYGMYVKRSLFDIDYLPTSLQIFFEEVVEPPRILRVGLEFETGNIASSFRAFQKLDGLFAEGAIDAGIFVTCEDKLKCASRIWPISNRNGSLVELINRKHRNSIAVPLWEYGFSPDGFRSDVPYLASNGTLFDPVCTETIEKIDGVTYEVWLGERGEQLLKKKLLPSVPSLGEGLPTGAYSY